ncbi:hypothetical protein T492DRAFT_1055838 [Pavlovales sp. CCMP2436]|nr:hypothetical protein T492DRAFT_1055838 [Pavlovales sp. CCMP2436]
MWRSFIGARTRRTRGHARAKRGASPPLAPCRCRRSAARSTAAPRPAPRPHAQRWRLRTRSPRRARRGQPGLGRRADRHSDRHRSGHHILVRWRLQGWQGRDYRQRPGQPRDTVMGFLHRHRTPHRRRCQEPGVAQPGEHGVRRQAAYRPEV